MNWDAFASFRFFVRGTVARPGSSAMIRNSRTSDFVSSLISRRDSSIFDEVLCVIWSKSCASFSDRKSTRLNSSHPVTSYAVFCLKKKKPCRFSWHD